MKIIIIGGFKLAQHALSISRGFKGIGWETRHIPSRGQISEHEERDRRFMLGESRYVMPDEFAIEYRTEADYAGVVYEEAKEYAPDLILWWCAREDVPKGLARRLRDICPVVYYTPDQLRPAKSPEVLDGFSHAVTCCNVSKRQIERMGIPAIVLYPPPCRTIHGMAAPTCYERCDISFTPHALYHRQGWRGMLATRDEMVAAVQGLGKLHIYGGLGDGTFPGLQRQAYRGWREYDELPTVYRSSKINLNQHNTPERDGYLNARALAIVGSGGFLLTDHVKGIEKIFDPGSEIATWRTASELREKAQWWLEHDDERKAAAKKAKWQAMREHGAEAFARKLVEFAT